MFFRSETSFLSRPNYESACPLMTCLIHGVPRFIHRSRLPPPQISYGFQRNAMAFAYQNPLKSNAALRNFMKLETGSAETSPNHSESLCPSLQMAVASFPSSPSHNWPSPRPSLHSHGILFFLVSHPLPQINSLGQLRTFQLPQSVSLQPPSFSCFVQS